MFASVWVVVAALGLGAAEPDRKKETPRGAEALLLPSVSYGSAEGFGVGAIAGAWVYGSGGEPYRHALGLHTSFGQRGLQEHSLRYDAPSLFGPLRLEGRLEFRHEVRHPLLGAAGAGAPAFREPAGEAHLREGRRMPGGWVRLRGAPLGKRHPLQSYLGYGWRRTLLDMDGAAVSAAQAAGLGSGPAGQVTLGVLWDTRDQELDPGEGAVEEVALRASGRAMGNRHGFLGLTLAERRYVPLTSRLLFAQRLVVDVLLGEAPRAEWGFLGGGVVTSESAGMVRGLARGQLAGPLKALSNSELRYHAASLPLRGAPLRLGLVGFLDLGRVWGADPADAVAGRWQPGVGAGLRLARLGVVMRLDYALSTATGQRTVGLGFGHMF